MTNNKIKYVLVMQSNYVAGIPTDNPKYAFVTSVVEHNNIFMIDGEEVEDRSYTVHCRDNKDALTLDIDKAYDIVRDLTANAHNVQMLVKLPWENYRN